MQKKLILHYILFSLCKNLLHFKAISLCRYVLYQKNHIWYIGIYILYLCLLRHIWSGIDTKLQNTLQHNQMVKCYKSAFLWISRKAAWLFARYSVKENIQLQGTQDSDYVIKPSQTVNLSSKLVIISRQNEISPPTN